MRHHEEADRVEPELGGARDVLLGDVGLGAVGRHAHRAHAAIVGELQVFNGADARQQQGGDFGALELGDHRAQVFLIGVCGEAVVDRGAAQAIAVRDFDERNPGAIQSRSDIDHLLQGDLVLLRVHAIAQAIVVQGDSCARKIHEALAAAGKVPADISSAISSPVRSAAAVMMSRLPA